MFLRNASFEPHIGPLPLGHGSPQSELSSRVLDSVKQLISSPEIHDLPGNSPGTPIERHRADLQNCLQKLRSEKVWSQQQGDANNRNISVGMQAIIENAVLNFLQENKANKLVIVVHTNNPP
ncbi:MAG: hypothetical protein HYZ77_04975, partial [Serratia liquefaciens]|nr:hypothetical protein [Serratia liquefaciens]